MSDEEPKEVINGLNQAGYTMTAIDTDVKEVEKMFGVNVFGPMRMVHIFHPLLIKARGKIVNIGSVGGIVPYVYGCKLTFDRLNCARDRS